MWVGRPAPSPERSVAAAPRWATRASACSARRAISAERCPDARATNPTPQASCSRQGSSSRERLWAQRDRSAAGIVSPVHDRSTERPALLGAGRGVCFESATRLRPPPAPIGGSRRIQNCDGLQRDRKSTRLNSSHGYISYAVFCLKKKNNYYPHTPS